MGKSEQVGSPVPSNKAAGTLYLVGTPIGNLEDITFRALRVLKFVDLIACEDTRRTQKLLNYYGIRTATTSYHEHNEMTRAPELIIELEKGSDIALVSDAGMPVVSDPGYRLVKLAVRHNASVVPIPGASAFLAALAASGLPVDKFRFLGFLPSKASQRRRALEEVKTTQKTLVLYEAPHRILEMLTDARKIFGDRPVVLAREVTKVHEEFLRGTASELLDTLKKKPVKGEFTVLVGPGAAPEQETLSLAKPISAEMRQLIEGQGLNERAALKAVARARGIPRSEAYRQWQAEKSTGK
jgi:16S rRNA (cytidine1402-2'-O)-methyltransferase